MKTVVHVKVNDPTIGLDRACEACFSVEGGPFFWPSEIFRICPGDGLLIVPSGQLSTEEFQEVERLVQHLLRDEKGGVLVTYDNVHLHKTENGRT